MDAPIFRLENMFILTNIPPRRDGTVVVDVGGTIYTFSRRIENGPLCCDVDSDEDAHYLLSIADGRFFVGSDAVGVDGCAVVINAPRRRGRPPKVPA